MPSRASTPTPVAFRRHARAGAAAGSTPRPSRPAPATPACTSSTAPAPASATSTWCSWRAWSKASGPSRRAATSSTRRPCCASWAGRAEQERLRRRARRVRRSAAAAGAPPGRLELSRSRPMRSSARRRSLDELAAAGLDAVEETAARPADVRPRGAGGSEPRATRRARPGPPQRGPRCACDVPAGDEARLSAARRAGTSRRALFAAAPSSAIVDCPFKFFAADVLRARGAARGRVGAVAARPRPVRPRGAAAVLRGVGPHRAPGRLRRTRSAAARAVLSRRPSSRSWPRCPTPTRRSSARGCSASAISTGRHRDRPGARSRARRPSRWSSAGWNIASMAPSRWATDGARGGASTASPTAIDLLAGPAAARHRLQVGPRAAGQARAAGAHLRAVRAGSAGEPRRRPPGRWTRPRTWRSAAPAHAGAGRQGRRRTSGRDADRRAGTRARRCSTASRAGEFPPRPLDDDGCRYCAYSSVCRKDYVGDE